MLILTIQEWGRVNGKNVDFFFQPQKLKITVVLVWRNTVHFSVII